MVNIFLEDPTYISIDDLTSSSRNSFINTAGADNEKKILIRQAEIIIDSIIKSYGVKVDPTQETIFPTVQDGIPSNIAKATVRIVENLYVSGELEGATSGPIKGSVIKAEKFGDHSVEYQDENVRVNVLQNKNKYITQDVELFLKPYINNVGVRFSKAI
ncbi:MAG TPA: hypothetical protein PKC87_00750 [Candidatus Absconditabacterales bacterium]|nr:hypothetical protein [Candidatus Absconditabacterales bacterium]